MPVSYDLLVVGAGPAGLMAGGTAAGGGARVLLLDGVACPGKKLYITGKGRCNLTNNTDVEGVLANVPRNPRFLYSALTAFPPAEVMALIEKLGVPLKTERGKRVFPQSDSAKDVASALDRYAAQCERRRQRVEKILIRDGVAEGVETATGPIYGKKVLVATGGCSYPLTGSTGIGYRLAEEAGHTIIPPSPSLVAMESDDGFCRALMGLSLKNCAMTFWEDGKKKDAEFGEMLFTHFGLSGPGILSGSAHFDFLRSCPREVRIDLKPALEEETLNRRLLRELGEAGTRDISTVFKKLLPLSMVKPWLRRVGIPPEKKANSITREEREKLTRGLKNTVIPISGPRPVEEAVVTRGGVKTTEVNPKTMESRLVKGLYFAGEILDVDGYTGGFNLQIAFSTGRAAGKAVLGELFS